MVENGKRISIEYTLKLDDGSTADSNVGGEPLVFVQGEGQVLPALESQLNGLKVNESKHVKLTAEQGYGVVDPDLFQSVEPERVPAEARQVGMLLVAQDDQGRSRQVRVHEVGPDAIVIDLNHPLAGQALNFDVKILGVE